VFYKMSSCTHCRTSARPLLACGGACGGTAVYCGEACQLADWRAGHADLCHIESEDLDHNNEPGDMVEAAICDAMAHLEVELSEHAEHNEHKIAAIEAHIALGEQLLEEGEHVGLSMEQAHEYIGRRMTKAERARYKEYLQQKRPEDAQKKIQVDEKGSTRDKELKRKKQRAIARAKKLAAKQGEAERKLGRKLTNEEKGQLSNKLKTRNKLAKQRILRGEPVLASVGTHVDSESDSDNKE
jgi:hypothetical protein